MSMDALIVMIGLLMVWIVITVILMMTYFGYDVRSRGFKVSGPVAATLPRLGIGLKAYRAKRDEHPIVDETLLPKVKLYRTLTLVFFVLMFVFIILIISGLAL